MRIVARGLTFDVTTGGAADGDPVLLLHGFPQRSTEWDLVTPALHDAGLRTYALDQRGYSPGARPSEVADYRIEECVADALAVLDELDVDAVHLIGHDWGAIVAWHLAARHATRIRTLTAVSVPHPAALGHAIRTDQDQQVRSSYIRVFQRPEKAERVLLADEAAGLRFMLTGIPAERADRYVAAMREPGALTAALNWYRAMPMTELADPGPVEVPTTFVWSDEDMAIGATAARACADHVRGDYRFVALADVTHWIPEQAPAALAEAALARMGR